MKKQNKKKRAIEKIERHEVEFDNYTLPYWLHKARALSLNSPLLVVKNKIDIHNKQPKLPPNANDLEAEFKITEFIPSAASDEKYFKKLRAAILTELLEMPEVGMKMPSKWLRVKEQVLGLKEEGNRTITLNKFTELCKEQDLSNGSIDTLIRFLHNTGTLFYQRDTFKDKIILDQKWALDGIYLVFRRDWIFDMLSASNGKTSLRGLGGVWGAYSLEERKIFLSMMISCEICFEVSKDKDNVNVLIPYYLPEVPSSVIMDYWKKPTEDEIAIQYWYPFFHSAFMLRFIAKAGRLVENSDRMWKKGIWISHRGTDALIQAFPREHYISVRVRGKDNQEFLKQIDSAFKEIHYNSDKVTRKVGFNIDSLADYHKVKNWKDGMELIDEKSRKLDINKFRLFKAILDPENEKKELKALANLVLPAVSTQRDIAYIEWDRSVLEIIRKRLNLLVKEGNLKGAMDKCLDITQEKGEFHQCLINLYNQFKGVYRKEIINAIKSEEARQAYSGITDSFQKLLGTLDLASLNETATREFLTSP